MEKFIKNVRFILICNYVGQIIPALQSRCTRFRFSPLPAPILRDRLVSVASAENISLSDEARDAIIRLAAGGDMRRILNVLQAASAAAAAAQEQNQHQHQSLGEKSKFNPITVTEEVVYGVTATPHPADLDCIFQALLIKTNISIIASSIRQIQVARGLALADIIGALFDRLAELELDQSMRIFLTKHLADIEYRLAQGASESVQLPAVIGTFIASRAYL